MVTGGAAFILCPRPGTLQKRAVWAGSGSHFLPAWFACEHPDTEIITRSMLGSVCQLHGRKTPEPSVQTGLLVHMDMNFCLFSLALPLSVPVGDKFFPPLTSCEA